MRNQGGTQNGLAVTIDAEGGYAMNEDTLNKSYREVIRSKHTHGARWQEVREVPANQARRFDAPNAEPENDVVDLTTLQRNEEIENEVTGRVRKLLNLAKQVLTEQQYNVFILTMVKDPALTYREAGKVLGISFGRVRQHADALRAKLEKAYNERT